MFSSKIIKKNIIIDQILIKTKVDKFSQNGAKFSRILIEKILSKIGNNKNFREPKRDIFETG